jgi:hypothetical protein
VGGTIVLLKKSREGGIGEERLARCIQSSVENKKAVSGTTAPLS